MGQADLLGCDRLAISYRHDEGADIGGKFTTIFFFLCFNPTENHNT